MDAFLSVEAHRALKALSLLSSKGALSGFLIGHKRGHRFFVENILPSSKDGLPSLDLYDPLDQLYEGKILGFFSFTADRRTTAKILKPLAFGKLFLEVRIGPKGRLILKSHVIEYNQKFFLLPVPIRPHKKGKI
ncbi:MAG: hypothetical protein WCC06_12505 [Candidatus Aminicenantales bacterium]